MREVFKFRIILHLMVAVGLLMLLGCNGDDDGNGGTDPVPGEPFWSQTTILPTTEAFERVWGLNAGDMFVVGANGVVFRGNGSTWDSLPGVADLDRRIYSVWGANTSQIFFAGSSVERDTAANDIGDTTLLLDFNGIDFEAVNLGIDDWLFDIHGSSSDNIFAVGNRGRIVRYDGMDWTALTSPGTVQLYGVWAASDSSVYACGQNGTVLHYDVATDSLRVLTTNLVVTLWDIWGFSDSSFYVVGNGGNILHWDGNGFAKMSRPTDHALYSVWGSSESNVLAVGESGEIYAFDGMSWNSVPSPTEFRLLSVWGTDASNVFAVGQTALRFDGTDWDFMEVRPQPTIYDIWTPSRSQGFAVGSQGLILRFTGAGWAKQTSGVDTTLRAVWGDPSSSIRFAAGDDGTILRYDGSQWSNMNAGIAADFNGIAGFDDTTVWAVGTGGTIAFYDGTSWSVDTVIGSTTLNDIWASTNFPLAAIAVGDGGEVWLYQAETGQWTQETSPTGGNLNSVWFDQWSFAHVVGDNGEIYHSLGDLDIWSAAASPVLTDLHAVWGVDTPSGEGLFAVGAGGVALTFTGSSWEIEETPTTADLFAVFGVTTTSVLAGGSWNHLLIYAD